VARERNADSIHPGYGFLSENLEFVREAEKYNINFIGPNSDTMLKMAAKDVAK
jgi:acetyl/propionyl-CoA carboxylase alpha subunit